MVDIWCDRGIKWNLEERPFGEKKDAFDFRLVECEVKMESLSRNTLENCEDMGPHFVSEVRTRHVD